MLRFLLFALVAAVPPAYGDDTLQRLDPAGFAGHLLVCGSATPSDEALEKSIALAGGPKAKLLVLYTGEAQPKALIERLQASAEKVGAVVESASVAALAKRRKNEDTCVWLTGGAGNKDAATYCKAMIEGKGVVALTADAIAAAGPLLPLCELAPGESLVPRAGHVGIAIEPRATLWLQGRDLRALGDRVSVQLRASDSLPARTILVQGKETEDLTALRRAALARNSQPFPPLKPMPPEVAKGTLFIVGGGGTPAGMFPQFVEAAKSAGKPNIVILPTAIPDPIPKRDGLVDVFKKAGAANVVVLKGRTLAEVESKEYLDALRDATGIWFDGGRQWRFVDAYEGTKAMELMHDVLRRGGVIGGTSAGATIQGDYLCRGSPFGNLEIRFEGYERGLGFLPGVAIDQHFTQRKRFADMTGLMKMYPQLLGIGIDESTALIVRGHVGRVSGKGKTYFYDRSRMTREGEPDYVAVGDGGRYDLKSRAIVEK